MADCNITQWIEKIFTDKECEDIVRIYNAHTGGNLSLALLPFLSHEALEKALYAISLNVRANLPDSDALEMVEDLIRKLDVNTYWVSISTIGDEYRREYNTVTEEHRATYRYDDADEIFGNVRSTL